MEHQIVKAEALLPAWFIGRMMTDNWTFGLSLTTGKTLVICTIHDLKRDCTGKLWIEVEMARTKVLDADGPEFIYAPTERTSASVAVDQIVFAYEMAST